MWDDEERPAGLDSYGNKQVALWNALADRAAGHVFHSPRSTIILVIIEIYRALGHHSSSHI